MNLGCFLCSTAPLIMLCIEGWGTCIPFISFMNEPIQGVAEWWVCMTRKELATGDLQASHLRSKISVCWSLNLNNGLLSQAAAWLLFQFRASAWDARNPGLLQSHPAAGQAEPSRDARDRLEGPRTADDVTGSRRRCVYRWERRKGEARLAAILMCKSIQTLKRNRPASHGL